MKGIMHEKNLTEYEEVKEIFNHVFLFFNAKISLKDLFLYCGTSPLLFSLLGHMYLLVDFDYLKCMKEMYGLFKKYAIGRAMTDEEWESYVNESQKYVDKYENNQWCMGVILKLLDYTEQADKRYREQYQHKEAA